jgi:eukaryotic-like serine/threonine-protein kinase
MSASHAQLAELFERAVALPAHEREAVLEGCDPATRARVERLLAADAVALDPLARAVAEGAGELVRPTASGARLGAYRVLREVGAGGMGSVLLAERADGQFEQQVAIKLIRGFPTAEGMRRLRQERQILAQLDHPNIAHLLDGGESDDGQPFVVMEFVDGLPLLEHIAMRASERAMHPAHALRMRLALFDRIAAAVQHAHERLVIHRDLKPGNILVRQDGEPKLLDFGVAKLVDLSAASDPRQTSTRVWTPGYASPEQQTGGMVTTATDVFGLAIVLREMLTGEREPGVRSAAPDFPALAIDAELRGILAKAAADAPADRYPTVEALRADLGRWCDGRPVRAAPDSAAYRARKFVRRHRVAVGLATLVLIAAGAFVWRLTLERQRALAAEARTAVALAAAERDAQTARTALGFLTDAIGAAVPEQSLDTQISVRELLDHARRELDARPLSPVVRQPVQRMLGQLYFSLGEPRIAVELFEAGLRDVQAQTRDEGLLLANDYDGYSSALGTLERGPESLAAAQHAASLRQRYAPDDPVQTLRALDQLGFGYYRVQDYARAERVWLDAIALANTLTDPPIDVVTNTFQGLGGMLSFQGEHARALELATQGLAFADRYLSPESPLRVNLLRTRGEALSHQGDHAGAEVVLRQAIALQERAVGHGGVRLASLQNGLGTVLNDLGRYPEAIAALKRAEELESASGGAPVERAIGLGNLAAVMESYGDYDGALALFEQAKAKLDEGEVAPDALTRRMLERNHARTLVLAGQHARAGERLAHLREQARTIDGEDSFEYAMTTWQSVVLARRMRDPVRGRALLAEAESRFATLVPDTHAFFAHVRRARAAFATMQGRSAEAEREQRDAIARLEAASVLPVELAVARAELAGILMQAGRRADARATLDQALPPLRATLLPQEIQRAAAEALDARLPRP